MFNPRKLCHDLWYHWLMQWSEGCEQGHQNFRGSKYGGVMVQQTCSPNYILIVGGGEVLI